MESHTGMSSGKKAGAGLLAGAFAGLIMTLAMLLFWWLLGLATPLAILGDRLTVFIPPGPFLSLMGRVGGYNHMKQLGIGSIIFGQLAVGGFGGIFYAFALAEIRKPKRVWLSVAIFILLPLVACALLLGPVLATSYSGFPSQPATVFTLLSFLMAFLVFERSLVLSYTWLARPPRATSPKELAYSPGLGRRALLLGGLGLLVSGGAAGVLRKLYAVASFSYDGTQYKGPEVEGITPNDKFYCVTKNIVDPRVEESQWRLEVNGMVEHRQSYKFDRLKSLPAVSQETTLMCISNGLGAGLMSNALWRGVPLRELIRAAGPLAGATKVRLHGVDNYADTFPLTKAMNPTTLVAYEMNGERLPDKHGFPARVVVPGYFGEKNVKWLTRIELTGPEAEGFYEKQGWGPNFMVPTRSRIDLPNEWESIALAEKPHGIPMKGIAFAGDRGVSKVEVTVDGGENWQEAKIDYPGTKLTWVLWSFAWQPTGPGEHKLSVRATDGAGALQREEKERGQFSGTSGFHEITVYLS